jgi:error-prone DNA polymerase
VPGCHCVATLSPYSAIVCFAVASSRLAKYCNRIMARELRFAELVTLRQTPSTAKHTTFMTVEDETGIVQVIVWNRVAQEYRAAFLGGSLLEIRGTFQHESGVKNVIALPLFDHTQWLGVLRVPSRAFH